MTKAIKAVDGSEDTMAKTGAGPWPLLTVDIARPIHVAEIWLVHGGKGMTQYMITFNLLSCRKQQNRRVNNMLHRGICTSQSFHDDHMPCIRVANFSWNILFHTFQNSWVIINVILCNGNILSKYSIGKFYAQLVFVGTFLFHSAGTYVFVSACQQEC